MNVEWYPYEEAKRGIRGGTGIGTNRGGKHSGGGKYTCGCKNHATKEGGLRFY